MVKRDAKKQKKPQRGSCEETEAQFEHVIGKVAIMKCTPSVAGARRKGAAGPKHVPGFVGVVPMHAPGEPDSPLGHGALLACRPSPLALDVDGSMILIPIGKGRWLFCV